MKLKAGWQNFMDLNEIKKWLTDPSERFVFVEDGKPAYVIMGFEAYRGLKGAPAERNPEVLMAEKPMEQFDLANARLELERIKTQELAVKLSMDREARAPVMPRESSEIRLEDLPL